MISPRAEFVILYGPNHNKLRIFRLSVIVTTAPTGMTCKILVSRRKLNRLNTTLKRYYGENIVEEVSYIPNFDKSADKTDFDIVNIYEKFYSINLILAI
jgi:hypothetical protein